VKPAPFAYHRPQTVADALALLAEHDGAKLLAGGQSLGPMLNLRVARPEHVIDLNDLLELDFVRRQPGRLEIGSLTRHHRVATDKEVAASCPLLAAAAATIGHYAIRQRGTLGGSLSHADPAAQLPLIATLLNAEIVVSGRAGTRTLRAREFFVSSLVTEVRPDEMIVAVRFPAFGPSQGWGLEIFSERHGDFAIVSVATTIVCAPSGAVEQMELALGGVAATPLSLHEKLASFRGRVPDAEWCAELACAAASSIAPDDDARIPAAYRRELAATLTRRALAAAAARARGEEQKNG
jgi:aerobic carbon-monoxide dehydrogenase medium subunit